MEKTNQENKQQKAENELEAELDKERPHIIIGYKKGSEQEVVTECGGGAPDKFEAAILLTHAQAINTLPMIQEYQQVNRALEQQKLDAMKETKKAERKGKNPKKQQSDNKDAE